jgi:hypothetical protein
MKDVYVFFYVVGVLMLVAILYALPTLILWNLLMPDIFGLPSIGFWQAIGLNLLSAILLKSNIKSNDK